MERVGLVVNAATDAAQATAVAQGLAYVSDRRGGARTQYLGWLPRVGGLRTRETPWERLASSPSMPALVQWIMPSEGGGCADDDVVEASPASRPDVPGPSSFRGAAQARG